MRHDGLMATVFAFFQKKKQHALRDARNHPVPHRLQHAPKLIADGSPK